MSSTLIYQLALFAHILGAFGLIATMTLESVGLRGLRHAATGETARAATRAMEFVPPLGAASGLVILATGLYMTATAWGVRGWIVVALAGLILNALSGALVTRSRMARIGPTLAEANGPLSREARVMLRDAVLLASLQFRFGVVLGILFVMTLKPSAVVSLAVIIVAAAIGVTSSRIPSRRQRHELRPQNG